MSKKILTLLLTTLMLFSFAACEKDHGKEQGTDSVSEEYVLKNEDSIESAETVNELDPQEVYSQLTYTPEMFYGDYRLFGGDEAAKKFGAESQYFTWTRDNKEIEFTKLPFRIETGKETMSHSINYVKDYNWMRLSYMRRVGEGEYYSDMVLCSYTISGNKLILKVLDSFEVEKESNKITYCFSDETWEYTFVFNGRNLTLSTEDCSITLTTGLNAYGTEDYFHSDNYLSPGSKSIDGIDKISFWYQPKANDSCMYLKLLHDEKTYESIPVLQENGLFTFTLTAEENIKTYQFVYFYGERDGIVLTDGTSIYYYNDSYADRNKSILSDYLTEDQTGRLDELSDTQLEAIVEKKGNLMEDLVKAFSDAGIKVTIDEKNGELAMDSSILFGGDSSVLTAEGKEFLNKFIEVYTSIVFSEKYEGFISKTMVEGHTAPVSGGTYESALPLSEERADNVKDYCVSSETGVDTSRLVPNLEAVGYSNSKPITDADGNVDMAASRRVSFRFIINLEAQ